MSDHGYSFRKHIHLHRAEKIPNYPFSPDKEQGALPRLVPMSACGGGNVT